ncbi:MAG: outer membrane lipoprotein-sorting protein [Sulfuricella sp.]|jgi:hypothetical protein
MNCPEPAAIGLKTMRHALLIFSSLFLAASAWADAAGDQLAQRVYDRPNGKDATSALTMTLTEKGRNPRIRKMITYRKDEKGSEVATLIRFTEPADIEGTGLLTIDPADGDSSQWIYLPAMERVRRIDSNRKGGRFVNSDYYYEDLRDRKVNMDAHRVIGRENLGGIACEMLESTPLKLGNSVYARRISWIDTATLIPLRIDFFEKKEDQPSKRLLVTKREKIQGYWTAMDSTLTDLDNEHQTRLTVEKILYDRRLPTRLFTKQLLEDESIEEAYRP